MVNGRNGGVSVAVSFETPQPNIDCLFFPLLR